VLVDLWLYVTLKACKNFDNNNVCEPYCPPEYIYSPSLFRHVLNPDAKYSYGSLCVDKCPCKLLLLTAYFTLFLSGLTWIICRANCR